jgi:type I restriction-modification system DNA methylase subunit
MARSTTHYADNDTNNILKRLHNKLRPAGTPVERVEYIIELLLLRIFEAKLKQDEIFKPLRKLFDGENYRLLFSYIHTLSNGDRILQELNKTIFPFYATILQSARKVVKGNLPAKMQDQLVLMEEVFANSNFTNNVRGGVITEVIGLVNEIDEKYILKTDLLGDAIESALSETGGTKDLGLYRTPDHIRQMMVAMIDPDFTDTIFDPACGTAGFLFDAYDYVIEKSNETGVYPSTTVANMFYRTGIGGIEYQGRIRKMAAVNMYIRGLNPHNIRQGDSLKMFDPARDAESKSVVIANPPFGAERDQPAYPNVWEEYSRESETTVLFVKLMFDLLKPGGRCAVVVSEGFLTWGQGSACALRKMLLNEANLRAIVSLPQGVFVSKSGQGAKTSILYFEKGKTTDFIWYYKIENDGFSMGTNRKPIEGSQIPELLALFKEVRQGKRPADTAHSFCIDRSQIETLDPQAEKRIKEEIAATAENKLQKQWNKKFDDLNKKFDRGKISKAEYQQEVNSLAESHIAIIDNEIARAIEKAHTYHFNLQNYRSNDEEKQTEFPLVELKELLTIKSNKITLDNDTLYKQVTIKLYGKGLLLRQKIEGIFIKTAGQYIVNEGDFIMSKIDARNGAFGIVPDFLNGAIVTSSFPYFEIKKEKINPKYLENVVIQPKFYEKINDIVSGATGRRSVEVDDFLSLQIPLPPLEIQNEIVEKIERQKEIIAAADKIEKVITFDIDIEPQWGKSSLCDLCDEIIVGGTPKDKIFDEGTIVYLKVNNLGFDLTLNLTNKYFIDDIVHNKELKRSQCFPGDVLMNIVGPPMGKISIVPDDITTCNINQAVICFRVSNKILNKYLAYYLLMSKTQDKLLEDVRKSTGQWNITKSICSKLQIPVPPLSVQREIVSQLDAQMSALESIRFLKSEAEKRVDGILARVWSAKKREEAPAPVIVQKADAIEEKPFLKRKILATYIINQSLDDKNFGDVKFEKLFYLSECFAIKRNFEQRYYVQVAGPYDNVFTREYFKQVEQSKWFNRQRKGNQYTFSKGEKHDKSLNTYNLFADTELEKVNKIIDAFKKFDYEIPEIVATLYAVWNNRLIRQELVTDEFLKQDFLNWDTQKIKYKDRLDNALNWMREHNFVPDGWGQVIEKAGKKIKEKHI